MTDRTNAAIAHCSIALILLLATVSASAAQALSTGTTGTLAGCIVSQVPSSGNPVQEDVPGLTNPLIPFVFSPVLKGELRGRPIFTVATSGEFKMPSAGISIKLAKDLGFEEDVVIVDLMARAQIARLSIRTIYDTWLSTFRSDLGHLSWPPFSAGMDIDLVNTSSVRLGANLDVYSQQPAFSIVLPVLGTTSIKWQRPATAGIHLAYNPVGMGGLAPSLEARARWPIIKDSRVTEYEIAGGATTPLTILGTTALRAGWRYTTIELRRKAEFELDLTWSGLFGELVYLY